MVNPLDLIMKIFFDNIFFFLMLGFGIFFVVTYLHFSHKTKYKIIDREEVERQKFVEAMKFNVSNKHKFFYTGDVRINTYIANGGTIKDDIPNIDWVDNEKKEDFAIIKNKVMYKDLKMIGGIVNYTEFEQKPITVIERQGILTYEENIKEKPMKLIGMVIKPHLFWIFNNPFGKLQPFIIENNDLTIKDGNKVIIPNEMMFDKFTGFYYVVNENSKPKIRNIIDARVIVQDFNLAHSRYFAKTQEECVYSPEVASQMAQLEKNLQIELAKKQGKQQTL